MNQPLSLEAVRHQAYLLWLERGCPPDTAERDWHDAEAMLRAPRAAHAPSVRFRRSGLVRLEPTPRASAATATGKGGDEDSGVNALEPRRRAGLVRLEKNAPTRRRAGLVRLGRGE